MAQSSPQDIGVNFANSVRDTLMGPINKAADAGEKIKNFIHNPISSLSGSSGTSGSTVEKINKDLNDKSVQDANQSFVDAANKAKSASQTSKPEPKPTSVVKKPAAPKYHDGVDYVPKTGPAILKKGEAVLNPEDAEEHRKEKKSMKKHTIDVSDELGGKKEKPKKEIKHIITKKSADGKHHIHTHVHTHPEHPDEEHVSTGNDGLVDHMLEHQGEPNPGEAEADAGQSGIEPQATAGAAAQPQPTQGMPQGGM